MPLYDFTCPQCGLTFEKLVRRSTVTTAECPCGSEAKRQAVNRNTGFALKGKGWYVDGYQKKSDP